MIWDLRIMCDQFLGLFTPIQPGYNGFSVAEHVRVEVDIRVLEPVPLFNGGYIRALKDLLSEPCVVSDDLVYSCHDALGVDIEAAMIAEAAVVFRRALPGIPPFQPSFPPQLKS